MFFLKFCRLITSASSSSIILSPSSFCSTISRSSAFLTSAIWSIAILILLLLLFINMSGTTLMFLFILIHCWQLSSTFSSLLMQPLHLLTSTANSFSLLCICQCSTNIFFLFFLTIFPNCRLFCIPCVIHSFLLLSSETCSHLICIAWVFCPFVLKYLLTSLLSGLSSIFNSIALNHSAFFPLLDKFW